MISRIPGFILHGIIILFLAMACPAAADSSLTVKVPVALAPAQDDPRDQLYPDIAHGSDTWLVTWQTGQNYHMGPTADVFAARLDNSGKLLDSHPVRLGTGPGSRERPRVAYSKSTFLVTWQDFRNGKDWDVYAARVNHSGKVLDRDGFLVAGGAGNQALPVVAPADNGFLVAWQDSSDSGFYQLRASLVNPGGKVSPGQVLKYQGNPKPKLWGYTPGWGYSRQPVVVGNRDKNKLLGGEAAIVRVDDGWLLSWNDETNWAAGGKGFITRRFARLDRKGNRVFASSIEASPALALGKKAGKFASDGESRVLYAGWPHTQRGRHYGAAVFLSGETAAAVTTAPTNDSRHQDLPGWNDGTAFLLFNRPFEPLGPVAVGYNKAGFLGVTVVQTGGKRKPEANRIIGVRLDQQGKLIDAPATAVTLAESRQTLRNVVVQGAEAGFLLAYQQEDDQGRQRIQAGSILTK